MSRQYVPTLEERIVQRTLILLITTGLVVVSLVFFGWISLEDV